MNNCFCVDQLVVEGIPLDQNTDLPLLAVVWLTQVLLIEAIEEHRFCAEQLVAKAICFH